MSVKTRLTGKVKSNKMQNTVVVEVTRRVVHPKYGKVMHRKKKYYAHSVKPVEDGDIVTMEPCRPLSKLKRWNVVEIKKSDEIKD